jgi:hypothetical protein
MDALSKSTSRTRRLVAAAVIAGVAVVPALGVTSAGASPHRGTSAALCQKESPAVVGKALGIKVASVSPTVNGNVTVCWYRVGALAHGFFVRTQTHDNLAGFNSDFKLAGTYQENPKTDPNFKPLHAFSTVIGSATYGYTYSVTVLKGTTELDLGGTNVTLAKVEGLAKSILPTL